MKTTLSIVGIQILSLISFGASAQEWIAGGAIGQAKQQDYDVGGPITFSDDTDDSFRVFGGYMFSANQGVIASYLDLGTTHYEGPAFGGFMDSFEAEGLDVSYVIGWPPGSQQRVSLFGTLGLFAWDQDVAFSDSTGNALYKDEGTSFTFGIGANVNLSSTGTNPLSIQALWQVLKDVGDSRNSGHEEDRDVVSVGVSYRFGRD
jgi:hypothetical protein